METSALFEEKVSIHPSDLSGKESKKGKLDIEALLLDKLSGRLQGKCSLHGYVIPGSLTILARSMGYVENGRFTGDIVYHVQAEGQVLYPPDGTVLQGRVEKKNAMGIFVVFELKSKQDAESSQMYPALKIILPRDLHLGNEEFDACEPGDMVELEIKKSRFQVNDEFILCVGDFIRRTSEARPPVPEGEKEAPPAEQEDSKDGDNEDNDDGDDDEKTDE